MPRKNPKRPGLKRPKMICESCNEPVNELFPDPRYKNGLPEDQKFCCFECKEEFKKGGSRKCPKAKNINGK